MNLASRYFRSRLETYLFLESMEEDYYRNYNINTNQYNNYCIILNYSSMHNKENNSTATSFTEHLHKKHQLQNQILKNFRYRFPQKPQEHLRSTAIPFQQKVTDRQVEKEVKNGENNQKIDSCALVVKGKLVYLQQQKEDITKDKKKLMRLLKQNNIKYKDYILGNKQKYLQLLTANQQSKKQNVVNDYIKQYINMQKNTKIETVDNYDSIKQQLFFSK